MRRKSIDVFDENQDTGRWLISYADFITLLFAFFVVMYSVSQVNENKYKILSESLVKAFQRPQAALDPLQIGEVAKRLDPTIGDYQDASGGEGLQDSQSQDLSQTEHFASSDEFKQLEQGLKESLGDLIDQELAEIKSDADWINISLQSALLFPSGSDQLNAGADPLLAEVARHLSTNRQLIKVHGHTDNVPIATERFPSNWELSAARAVAVVRKLQNLGIEARRMSVEGHGEYMPIASNATPEGRAKNRRVVISISRKRQAPVIEEGAKQPEQVDKVVTGKESEPQFEIIQLPGGGILIRGKESPPPPANDNEQ